ncbi:MAG: I78 family peptidase inhibitor [Alphaproteobacteria bacterium]
MLKPRLVQSMALCLVIPALLANTRCEEFYDNSGIVDVVDTTCGSNALSPYVGESIWLVPPSLTDSDLIRIIRSGDAVTMDYNQERLNISLNDDDEIVEVTCG